MNHPKAIDPTRTYTWTEERLYNQAEDYFDSLVADIDSSVYSVDLESYIFDQDPVGERVFSALVRAHRRGVAVRVMMDGAGTYASSGYFGSAMEKAGLQVKIFHPLPWQVQHYRRSISKGSWPTKMLTFFRRINQRDHRKLCIVDGLRLWSGSFNISATHLSRAAGGEGWRDYGVCVEGPLVQEVRGSFDQLWRRQRPRKIRGLFRSYWQNATTTVRKHRNRLLLKLMNRAENQIWIVSAYFSPSLPVVRALRKAAARGVDVRIIVPKRSDIPFFPLLTSTYYADLLSAGIKIYEYTQGMIHAKAVIIDDLCLIGSTNFNHRSFLHDLELDIQLQCPESKETLHRWFHQDMAISKRVSSGSRLTIGEKMVGHLAKLLRYWL